MTETEKLAMVSEFYKSFHQLDATSMVQHYHNDVTFCDPAFGVLKGEHARNMWRMLCASQKGRIFTVNLLSRKIYGEKVLARWEAHYTFQKTKRRVHNVIDASFSFKDGKIFHHVDEFDFYRWSRQALGVTGWLIGWTPYLKSKVNAMALHALDKFE